MLLPHTRNFSLNSLSTPVPKWVPANRKGILTNVGELPHDGLASQRWGGGGGGYQCLKLLYAKETDFMHWLRGRPVVRVTVPLNITLSYFLGSWERLSDTEC